jgi:hypothetical protein
MNTEKIGKIWKKSKLNSDKIWKTWKIPSFISTPRKNLAIILSIFFGGGIYPGALFSPIQIEVKKSVITFM